MFNGVELEMQMRTKLWAEEASTTIILDNIRTREDGNTNYEHFHNNKSSNINYIRTFGEVGITGNFSQKQNLNNKGRTVVYLGTTNNHPQNVHRFMNISTKAIMLSLDMK